MTNIVLKPEEIQAGMFMLVLQEQPPPIKMHDKPVPDYTVKLPISVGDIIGCRDKGKIINHIEIVNVDVKRVQEMPVLHWREINYILPTDYYIDNLDTLTDMFKDYFNDLYAKPQPVKKHGKVVSYKCYLYSPKDIEWFIENYAKCLQSTCDSALPGYVYKGLPLEIIPNPVMVLGEYRKR